MMSSTPVPFLRLGKTKGRLTAHLRPSRSMNIQDLHPQRRVQVDLVDDQADQSGVMPGPPLRGILVTSGNVDHIQRQIGRPG